MKVILGDCERNLVINKFVEVACFKRICHKCLVNSKRASCTLNSALLSAVYS